MNFLIYVKIPYTCGIIFILLIKMEEIMNINIIAVGKIKEKFMKQAINEFLKRMSRYGKVKVVELQDEKAPQKLSQKDMERVKEKEGERILQKIPKNSFVITLEIEGKQLSSEEFAGKLESLMVGGRHDITFVIGGSLGLSKSVKKERDFKLSFSNMTFPHQIMRLVLLEQIYRAFRIMRNEPYHK